MGMHSFRAGEEVERELEFIKQTLGTNQSQAIAASVHSYYKTLKELQKEKSSLIDIFEDLGLIGAVDEPLDLSERYKETIADSIEKKVR